MSTHVSFRGFRGALLLSRAFANQHFPFAQAPQINLHIKVNVRGFFRSSGYFGNDQVEAPNGLESRYIKPFKNMAIFGIKSFDFWDVPYNKNYSQEHIPSQPWVLRPPNARVFRQTTLFRGFQDPPKGNQSLAQLQSENTSRFSKHQKKHRKITPTHAFFQGLEALCHKRRSSPPVRYDPYADAHHIEDFQRPRLYLEENGGFGSSKWKGRPYCLMVKVLAFQMGYIYGIY